MQRTCAKHDTTRHFGPFSIGRLSREGDSFAALGEPSVSGVAFYSHWAAEEIAQAITRAHPNARWIRPRRRPGAFLDGNRLHLVELDFDPTFVGEVRRGVRIRPSEPIDTEDAEILTACTGERTLAEIFDSWRAQGPERDWSRYLGRVEYLKNCGALIVE